MFDDRTSRWRAGAVAGLLGLALSGCTSPRARSAEGSAVASETPVALTPDALTWRPLEVPGFPPGRQVAVLQGDPRRAGTHTIRIRLPAGYRFPAHWHPTDEQITVVSGTFLFAMGERFDGATLRAHGPGDFLMAPARMPHYGGAGEETVIQLHGTGPFETTVVDPYLPTAAR